MSQTDMIYVGPFIAPIVYVVCFISMITSLLLVFLPRYRDNLLERIGSTFIAVSCIAIWYHMVDGFLIPRALWAYGWGMTFLLLGLFSKLPRRK